MHSLSVRIRLTLIRPAVQQLLVHNTQVEFRSKEGGEEESVQMQEESHLNLSNFRTRPITESLQATSGSFPLSIKPCA